MITAYFDGSKKGGNDGVATYGYVIFRGQSLIDGGYGIVGIGDKFTNNIAEYHALYKLVRVIKDSAVDGESIVIKGDSRLVINQTTGKWHINNEEFLKYIDKIRYNIKDIDVMFVWIPREENTYADNLTKIAYNEYIMKEMENI